MKAPISNNPLLAWEQILPNFNDLYTFQKWRSAMSEATWMDSSTYDALLPKLQEARKRSDQFYQRFDYSWVLKKQSYEYQNEVLYQYLALTALKGLWYSAPEDELDNSLFDNFCLRSVERQGLKSNSPCRLKPYKGWNFVRTTQPWFDVSALAFDGFCLSVSGKLNIDSFDRTQHVIDLTVIKPLWDSMIISSFIGWTKCHEFLKPELAARIASEYNTSTIRKENTEPNRATDRLNEFSLRFTMAHEVGHHLEKLFVKEDKVHPELLADYLALISLNSQKWNELRNTYSPLLNDAGSIPIVAGQSFYFVLGMWITSQNIVGESLAEPENKIKKRTTEFYHRIKNWRSLLNHPDFNHMHCSDSLFNAFLDHIVSFEKYANFAVPAMKDKFDIFEKQINSEYPNTGSADELERLIEEHLS